MFRNVGPFGYARIFLIRSRPNESEREHHWKRFAFGTQTLTKGFLEQRAFGTRTRIMILPAVGGIAHQ
jgi:hypothetical protein